MMRCGDIRSVRDEPLPIRATPMGARSSETVSCCMLDRSMLAA